MDRRRPATRHREAPLVSPLDLSSRMEAASATTRAGGAPALTYEMQMSPPPGVEVHSLTVGGSYRKPIPILYDYQSRTAYPIPVD